MKEKFKKFKNFFLFFSSEDYYLIKEYRKSIGNSKKDKKKKIKLDLYFTIIGLLVFLLFIGTTFSFMIFVFNTLKGYSKLLSIPIGIFLGLLIANIYYFLLYTISPVILPKADKKKKKKKKILDLDNKDEFNSIFSFSFIFRFLFIAFIAIIISQPLSEFVIFNVYPEKYAKTENLEIERYKAKTITSAYILKDDLLVQKEKKNVEEFNSKIEQIINLSDSDKLKLSAVTYLFNQKYLADNEFINQLKIINKELSEQGKIPLQSRNSKKLSFIIQNSKNIINNEIIEDKENLLYNTKIIFDSPEINKAYKKVLNNWKLITEEKLMANQEILNVLKNNAFYTLKLKLLSSGNFLSQLISIIFIAIFSSPIIFKYMIRKRFDYYAYKANLEKEIISNAYNLYIKQHNEILNYKIEESITDSKSNLKNSLEILKKHNKEAYYKIKEDITYYTLKKLPINKYEHWADPPFRTKRKSEKVYKSEKDLLNKIYQEWE
ncbi:hypothetical protein [Chishuiella sp.]|uniref:hypothetical protein n=1 Tax=Chishuiella sp. TaxID=1969467 RepID=UPI0028AD0C32|nr:hypothetical protein [Chishuiella sp.]